MIEENAYAKINIGLEVGKIRDDGYHQMNSILVPIDICDKLTFEEIESGIVLVDNTNIKTEDNFVYKAAKLFKEEYQITKGVMIHLTKNIPSEAGLGGGSSDAAATLRGLNRLFNKNRSLDELAKLASRLGSDMPFCIYQQPAFCTGRGEEVSRLDLDLKNIKLLIVKPPYGLSTKDVYQAYDYKNDNNHEFQFDAIKTFLETGDLNTLEKNIFNDLEAPAFKIKPELFALKEKIESLGNIVFMSGSGTALCVFNETGDFSKIKEELKFYTLIETTIKI